MPKRPREATSTNKIPAAVSYAWKATRTLFEDPLDERYTLTESGDTATAAFLGEPYALLRRLEREIEVTFRAPRDAAPFERVRGHYTPGDREGWLCFRAPATRDPRPWLDADFGSLVGAMQRELRLAVDGTRFHSVLTAGGPLLVMPSSRRVAWFGAREDKKAYQQLAKGKDPAHVTTVVGGPALILTSPDETTWVPTPSGGVLVQIVSFSGVQDRIADQVLTAPDAPWSEIAKGFAVTESLHAFDAALSGGSVGDAESLILDLAHGRYRIDTRTFLPDEDTEFTLVRFLKE